MNDEFAVNERRYVARTLYTQCNKTVGDLSDELKVEEATIKEWVCEGAWDLAKTSLVISKEMQLKKLYELVGILSEKMEIEKATPQDVDLLLKYTAIIKNLDTSNSVYAMMDMAEIFLSWLHHRNAALSHTFIRQFELFITESHAA